MISALSLRLFCTAALLFLSCTVAATNFQVSPLRADLSEKAPTAVFIVKNESNEPVVIHLETVAWAQENGEDVYSPTRELIANPLIFTLPQGRNQVVRIGLRRKPDQERELTYRLYLREVPAPKEQNSERTKVGMALRIGLPVFVLPAKPATPAMKWTVTHHQGGLKVSLVNTGNQHLRVSDFSLSLPGTAETVATQTVSTYVLAGQTKNWLLKPQGTINKHGKTMRLRAFTDAGNVDTEVELDKL